MLEVVRPRTLTSRFLVVIVAIALADLMATAVAWRSGDDLPLAPVVLRTVTGPLRDHVDGYSRDPQSFGFTTTPGRPLIPGDGQVRKLVHGRRVFDPDASLRYALAALASYESTRDSSWLQRAETATREVLTRSPGGLVRHSSPRTDADGNPLPQGWVSAETQGLLLSALSRLHSATGTSKWGTAADEVFVTLLRYRGGRDDDDERFDPWLSYVDGGGMLWFEQLPQASAPTQTMTSHLAALIGIYDYAQIRTGPQRNRAEAAFADGATTALWYAPALWYPGGATYTSHTKRVRSWDLHPVVVAQLRLMARITGVEVFRTLAETYHADGAAPDYLRTGIVPRGDVDAYAPGRVDELLPPVGPVKEGDPASPERSAGGPPTPDQRLADALRQLSRYEATREAAALARARSVVNDVLLTTNRGLVPHVSLLRNPFGEPLRVPWYSAQTQGLMLSALVRLREATGEQRWADEAGAVFASLELSRSYTPTTPREAPDRWTSFVGDYSGRPYLWFEKYSPERTPDVDDAPTYVIDAHLTAVIGVYDYWRMTRSPAAARLFDGAVSSVAARLSQIRRQGAVSRTTLQLEIFRLDHHRVVTSQLRLLSRMTAEPSFAAYARQLARDAS